MFITAPTRRWCLTGVLPFLALTLTVFAHAQDSHTAEQGFFQQLALNAQSKLATETRMEHLSRTLLGQPYLDGNLGEGAQGKYDRDPLSRFDVFDCTTFVETVLAGAMSQTQADFAANLTKLRYHNGQISFTQRNHFASADWLPNNQWALQDITRQVGLQETQTATTLINKPAWYRAMKVDRLQGLPAETNKTALLQSLHAEGNAFQAQTVHTLYVPLTALFKHSPYDHTLLDRIPSGSIISMVRPNFDATKAIGTHLNITHQSIAIRKAGVLYLRHASQTQQVVMDEEFVSYFKRFQNSASLKGFNVQQPRF